MNQDTIKLAAVSAYYRCLLDNDEDMESLDTSIIDVLDEQHIDFSDEDLDAIFQYAEAELV